MNGVAQDNSLLLVTHVPIRQGPRGLQIDDQTAAGIAQWLRHFDRLTYYGIEDKTSPEASSTHWVDIAGIAGGDRCTLAVLPRAYGPGKMLKHYGGVRRQLAQAIAQHRHLCFTLGALVGDWPSVAAFEAIRQKRGYSAWIDRIEPLVLRNKLASASSAKRAVGTLALPIIERVTRHLLHHSAVALLQGRDTYDYYAARAPDPHCTYDTHTHLADQIGREELESKQQHILSGAPLRIVYTGRAAAMKGPGDWLDVLERLGTMGVPFRATWVGNGPALAMMQQRVAGSALAGSIDLPGFEGNRDRMLQHMREGDVFLFCHKTPESPRCLIEALVSGAPLVGYDTAYPRGLVEQCGGAALTAQNDVAALAQGVAALHQNRGALARLVAQAAASGGLYNEDAVYAHRAELMKRA